MKNGGWKKALVVAGADGKNGSRKFDAGEVVYVKKTEPIGHRQYYRVYNPRNGYRTSKDGGWHTHRFKLIKHELDYILGVL